MQPDLLLVELHWKVSIAKKQAIFDQNDSTGTQFESWVIKVKLMWENEQIQKRQLGLKFPKA